MRLLRLPAVACLLIALAWPGPARAQQVAVEELVLDNGMKVLLVPRKGEPTVAAGWIARVGSVNERPGITGISHLFEHMMFKGTRVIGTRDIEEDLRLQQRMDAVKAQLREEERDLARRRRLGEIADVRDPKVRTPRHQQLLDELARLEAAQRDLIVKNEFDRIYTNAGATGINAATSHDYTVYFITVPANKLELWFWMESDRLANPVFREFYSERDVVREERRLRIESTPTGRFQEEFDALFWSASPYHWPIIGWPSDVENITREEALAFYDVHYAPNNLTACLVGDFDPAVARALAQRYFGRLPRNPRSPEPVRTVEVEPQAERRMVAYAETNPQAQVRFLTVAAGHRDEAALSVAAALLSGRTGRLYRSLVIDQKIATDAAASQVSRKWEGFFAVSATARPGIAPEQVEQAISRELEKLQTTLVGERELQKVKNRFAAETFRRVQDNFQLMLQLLVADNARGWRSFNEDPKRLEAVTAEDVQRVAQTYFKPHRRAVLLFHTKRADATTTSAAPGPDSLSAEERAQVERLRASLPQMPAEQVRQMLERLSGAEAAAPPEKQRLLRLMRDLLEQRLKGA